MAQERNGAGRRNEGSDKSRGERQGRDQRREHDQGTSGWHGEGYGGGRHSEDKNEFGGEGRFREDGGHGSHFGGAPEGGRGNSDTAPGETGPPRSRHKPAARPGPTTKPKRQTSKEE